MQVMTLELLITAENADEVIAKLKEVGATAGGAAAEGVEHLDSSFDRMAERLTERFGIYEVLDKTIEGLKEFASEGIAASEAANLLDFQLGVTSPGVEGLGTAADSVVRSVSAMGRSTGLEVTQALQHLLLITNDTGFSLSHLAEAQDIASATGQSLEWASTQLGRAYEGQFTQLQRYLPFLRDAQDQMGTLEARTKGATEKLLENAGAWTKLGTEAKNAFEELGKAAMANSAPVADFLSKFPSSITARILEGVLTLGGSELLRALSGPSAYPPGTAPGTGGIENMPPTTPGLGVTITGRPATEEEANLAYLRYQQQQLENELKLTKDVGERLRLKHEIYELEKQITEELKKQSKLSAEQEAAEKAIEKAIPHEASRERFLGTGPSIEQLQPSLSPLAHQVNIGQGVDGLNDQAVTQYVQRYVTDPLNAQKDRITSVANTVGQALGDGITAGMEAHHGQISAGVKAMGAELLSAFGGYLITQGEALLAAAALSAILPEYFGSVTPREIFVGTGMIALGGTLKGVGQGIGGGGGAGGGGSSVGGTIFSTGGTTAGVNTTQYIKPTPGQPFAAGHPYPGGPIQPTINIIGTNDPSAMNQFKTFMSNMMRRGMLAPGTVT